MTNLIPPHSDNVESLLIGSLLIETDSIFKVIEFLKPEHFYQKENQMIYKTIVDMARKNMPIDICTVYEEVQKDKNGKLITAYDVAKYTEKVGSACNILKHAQIITEKAIRRDLIANGQQLVAAGYDETIDIEDTMSNMSTIITNVTRNIARDCAETVGDILPRAINIIEDAATHQDGLSGIPTGFNSLDRITQGWQKTDMIVIAARPSMGKTAFTLSMAVNQAKMGTKVLFFSLEMSKIQIVNRLLSMETSINQSKIRGGSLNQEDWHNLESKVQAIQEFPLVIDDESSISTLSMRAKVKNYIQKFGCEIVMVDYLQLMRGSQNQKVREQEIREISSTMKQIAKENNVPVIVLSQLNRAVETRQDKRPMLADLRESGSIEQDADIVCFVHRPEKYGIEVTEDGEPTKDLAQIIVAKNRNGEVCDVNLKFNAPLVKFEEWDF